jgi:tetratricopeptide (TPR) repeat protein
VLQPSDPKRKQFLLKDSSGTILPSTMKVPRCHTTNGPEGGIGVDGSFLRLKSRIDKWVAGDPSEVLDPVALDEARRLWETTIAECGDAEAVHVDVLMVLAYLHLARAQHFVEAEADEGQDDFDTAIRFFSMLAERVPERVPSEIMELFTRVRADTADPKELAAEGTGLLREYQRTGDVGALDTAVAVLELAVKVATLGESDEADVVGFLSNLSSALMMRFDLSGDDADLTAAIDFGRQAVTAASPGSSRLTLSSSNLAAVLATRFKQKLAALAEPEGLRVDNLQASDLKDLNEAIEVTQEALALCAPEDPARSTLLSNLESWLDVRSQLLPGRTGAPDGTEEAARLADLAVSLGTRFEQTGDPADLDAAIDAGSQAVAATRPGDPELAFRLSDLAVALGTRFEHAGDAADLDAAIDAGSQAAAAALPGGPARAWSLATLANSLMDRFGRTRDNGDLDTAIDAGRLAVDAAPSGHRDHAKCVAVLGRCLSERYEQTGNTADLDEAIDAERQAVAATSPDDPRLVKHLSNLAGSLTRRFQHSGSDTDLGAALEAQKQAAKTTPPSDPLFFTVHYNLSIVLQARYERTKNGADLDAAIDRVRQAGAAAAAGDPALAEVLSTLGTFLRERYERTGDSADLDEAIQAGRRAVSMAAAAQPGHLVNLGLSLGARFERTRDTDDLDGAIDMEQQAAAALPSGHPALAEVLTNLGMFLQARFDSVEDAGDLADAIDCWQRSASAPTAKPHVRLLSAIRWGKAAARADRMHDAAEAYAAAIALLEIVAWHGMDRVTQQKQLARFTFAVVEGATCTILDGRPETAVELLEQGRSVLWNQALNLRSDLARLAEKSPALAERLDNLRKFLDTPAAGLAQQRDDNTLEARAADEGLDVIDRRRQKARDWDTALLEARALDGFEHFLTAPRYSELAASQTAEGPTVVVNASPYGCHALIIAADSARPELVSLPGMTIESALIQADKLGGTLHEALNPLHAGHDWSRLQQAVFEVLGWLWDTVTEPVLAALDYTRALSGNERWPRVWWCPTGPLTMLPLHAAGHYSGTPSASGRESDCVPGRVVSSYTPTITALARTRRPRPPARARHLTVGMPTTPGQPALPGVVAELEILARHFAPGENNCQLSGPQATRASVLSAISEHSWIHLTCHGLQDDAAPDRSGFALWDGLLTIADLAALPTQRRDLAFLSACQTAAGSLSHLDEALHLAAAMQFLGYQHVIATMWSVADRPSVRVADRVYAVLAGREVPSADEAARALHRATNLLRHEHPADPMLWAPYIHFGP